MLDPERLIAAETYEVRFELAYPTQTSEYSNDVDVEQKPPANKNKLVTVEQNPPPPLPPSKKEKKYKPSPGGIPNSPGTPWNPLEQLIWAKTH